MGEIIRFPVSLADYPDTSTTLDPAECVLLSAIRGWVEAYRLDEDPMPRLSHGLKTAGAPDAAQSVDALMRIVASSVVRPISVHCPRCRGLSDDEKQLLHAATLAQIRGLDLAERALGDGLLTRPGAVLALGPLQGLGTLLAEAGLFFRQRNSPDQDADWPVSGKPWRASTLSETIH